MKCVSAPANARRLLLTFFWYPGRSIDFGIGQVSVVSREWFVETVSLDVNNPSIGAVEHVVPLLVLTHVVAGVEGANHQGLFRKLLAASRCGHQHNAKYCYVCFLTTEARVRTEGANAQGEGP